MTSQVNLSREFNGNVSEYHVDPTWQQYTTENYRAYRKRVEDLLRMKELYPSDFPLCIEVEATYHCNLECPFCARGIGEGYRASKHMDDFVWRQIVKEARENYLPSMMMDHEGESLLNLNLENMISDAKDAGVVDIWLHTNGQALTEKRSEQLIEAGLTKINISIDAFSDKVYSVVRPGGSGIQKVVENVKAFLDLKKAKGRHDLRVRVSFVATEDNRQEMESFFHQWRDSGVNVIAFQKVINMSVFGSKASRQQFIDESISAGVDIRGFSCNHLWLIPVIDVDGNIIPCGMPVRDHSSDFVLGNISRGDTIKNAWVSAKAVALRSQHISGKIHSDSMCYGCAYAQMASDVDTTKMIHGG
jgi:radical SAM protein with 4Fe4S-binding SPASM domain